MSSQPTLSRLEHAVTARTVLLPTISLLHDGIVVGTEVHGWSPRPNLAAVLYVVPLALHVRRMISFRGALLLHPRPLGTELQEAAFWSALAFGAAGIWASGESSVASWEAQKRLLAERLSGAGWVLPRIVEHMMTAPDFHFDSISQIRMDGWSRGRKMFEVADREPEVGDLDVVSLHGDERPLRRGRGSRVDRWRADGDGRSRRSPYDGCYELLAPARHRFALWRSGEAGLAWSAGDAGRRTRNVVPTPSSDSTSIVPPWA